MSFMMYLAGDGPGRVVTINDLTVSTGAVGASTSAQYELRNNGEILRSSAAGGVPSVFVDNWIEPTSSAGADYECRATLTSGSFDLGTAGSWLSLGSARIWGRNNGPGVGTNETVFTLEIRDASTLEVLDSATITLQASLA